MTELGLNRASTALLRRWERASERGMRQAFTLDIGDLLRIEAEASQDGMAAASRDVEEAVAAAREEGRRECADEVERLRDALGTALDIIEANPGEDICRHGRYVDECDGEVEEGEPEPCIDRSRRERFRALVAQPAEPRDAE